MSDRHHQQPPAGTPHDQGHKPPPGMVKVPLTYEPSNTSKEFSVEKRYAPYFVNGGVDADAFNAADANTQYGDSSCAPLWSTLVNTSPSKQAMQDWLKTADTANKPLAADYPKCPTGLTGIVHPKG